MFDCVDTSELSGVTRLDSGMRVCLITKDSEMILMFRSVWELNHSENDQTCGVAGASKASMVTVCLNTQWCKLELEQAN